MKKLTLIITMFVLYFKGFSQCNTKTTHRPDGVTMEYFNPQPVIRATNYEVGVSVYKNKTSGDLLLNLSVLFKSMNPKKLSGNAIIQINGNEGIKLPLVLTDLIKMNGRDLALGLFLIDERSYEILKSKDLKSIFFYLNGELIGSTVTEGRSLLKKQLECLNY